MEQGSFQSKKNHLIYDVLYGFIQLTPVEWEIIHSPFYQRLRWIKQLGFSFYTYPGAEHSRYGHSIGVLHNADCILNSIGRGADKNDLINGNFHSKVTLEHQSIRVAALLHDIGTFPFSHTVENSYIGYAESSQKNSEMTHQDNHEHLGSFIIKRTKEAGGITNILEKHGLDPQRISNLVKGIDASALANQILHSEIDCDRMDYLLRDAHYTGLQYGTYDREYLLYHFTTTQIAKQDILVVKEKAINCIQDFLISRFAWYSQVVRSARGAKFDAIAEEIAFYFLKENIIWHYSDLLDIIENDPVKFYSFNDHYFHQTALQYYSEGKLKKNKKIQDMVKSLLFGLSPATIKHPLFMQRILEQDNKTENDKILKRAREKFNELAECIKKKGNDEDWIIQDFPKKDIYLVKSHKRIVQDKTQSNVLLERDPVKILTEDGNVLLLSNFENNLVSKLQNSFNFIPHAFCSQSSFDLLKSSGMIE
ncbi:MAG: HD domain-containing protein [Halobacteriovoraceae bacterium]|nr:HD domain-containing protein [Halobacteriovoraceae bacterium]MCB9093977.1 HD domain-containing protein [Halobacteriovoraceae bacterium]